MITCSVCGTYLYGGLDTFGPVGQEVCQDCQQLLDDRNVQNKVKRFGLSAVIHVLRIGNEPRQLNLDRLG